MIFFFAIRNSQFAIRKRETSFILSILKHISLPGFAGLGLKKQIFFFVCFTSKQ